MSCKKKYERVMNISTCNTYVDGLLCGFLRRVRNISAILAIKNVKIRHIAEPSKNISQSVHRWKSGLTNYEQSEKYIHINFFTIKKKIYKMDLSTQNICGITINIQGRQKTSFSILVFLK